MQEEITTFYEDLSKRIRFIREKKGITLKELANGSASTAQSWEQGKQPRKPKWRGISERLGLSESFIFLGKPRSKEDYDFIATFRNEIGEPPGFNPNLIVEDRAYQYKSLAESGHLENIKICLDNIYTASTMADDATRGWVLVQLLNEVPYQKILKGVAVDDVPIINQASSEKKPETYKSSKIENTPFEVTENPDYQEKPKPKVRYRPEGPAGGRRQSDEAESDAAG